MLCPDEKRFWKAFEKLGKILRFSPHPYKGGQKNPKGLEFNDIGYITFRDPSVENTIRWSVNSPTE